MRPTPCPYSTKTPRWPPKKIRSFAPSWPSQDALLTKQEHCISIYMEGYVPTTEGLPDVPEPLRHLCPDCKTVEMQYVTDLKEGNCQGYGAEDLYQCPVCKTVAAR